MAFGGDGVARISDLVLFVPFTVDGDEAEVEITEIRKRYARGRLVRIIAPSRHRVPPVCPDYTRCGGCRMQHIDYDHQLELKRRQVEEAFKRIAGIAPAPCRASDPLPAALGLAGEGGVPSRRRPRRAATGRA